MIGVLLRLFFLCFFIAHLSISPAQTNNGNVAAWLLPGVSWQVSPQFRMSVQPGYNHYYKAGIGYFQGFITVHKNIVLNPGYMYFISKTDGEYRHHHFFMNGVTGQVRLGQFLLDDRNILWSRIGDNIEPLHYYRNRLRLTRPFQLAKKEARIYGYNEAFRLLNTGTWTRNRFAAGASYDIIHHANIDITYIRQWDRTGGWLHLFFIMAIWKIRSGKK